MTEYNGTQTVAPVDRHAVIPEVIMSNCVRGFAGQRQKANLGSNIPIRLPDKRAFFVRQSDKFID